MDRDDRRTWDADMDFDDDPASAVPPDGFVESTYVPGIWPKPAGDLPPLARETRRMRRVTLAPLDERTTTRIPAVPPPSTAHQRTTARVPAVAPSPLARERTTARIPAAPPAARPRAAWADAPTVRVPADLPPLPPRDGPRAPLPAHAPRDRNLRTFCEAPTGKGRALPKGVAIIPGNARPAPHLPRQRHSVAGIAAFALASVIMFAVTIHAAAVSRPASYDGLAADVGLAAGSSDAPNPGSAWQANAAVVPLLGGGGASAPWVDAPGTAAHVLGPQAEPKPTATATARPAASTPPAPKPKPRATAAPPKPAPAPASKILPAPVHPWPPTNPWMSIPGHTPYAVTEPANDPYRVAFGQCTWWAQHEKPNENLRGMGNARYWASGARARGYRVGTTPAVNATVVLQPGAQGAGEAGHVAHVLALYPGGWFLVSEMNAYGNGGGWGRVSFRYMHTGSGVQFIY